jgi:hypothetical protein
MKSKSIVVMASGLLSACALAWGQSYHVEFASSSSITINYDPGLTNMGEIQNVAQENCDKYGKDAIPQSKSNSPWGLSTMSFVCVRRTN